jgi:hypothetical protein
MRFLSQGSVWQLFGEDSIQSEAAGASEEVGLLTDPESRHTDAYVGGVTNLDVIGEDEQHINELTEDLSEIKKSLDEMRDKWAEEMQGMTGRSRRNASGK